MTLPPIHPQRPTFGQFRARVDSVHRKRNKLARRHLSAVRLGCMKDHARDINLKLVADREEGLRRERAQLKERERRRKKLAAGRAEEAERTRHTRLMRERGELAPASPKQRTSRVYVRPTVCGYEVARRDLRTVRRPRLPRAAPPRRSHVVERDRMAEAALAEAAVDVPVHQRLFTVGARDEPRVATADHRALVDENVDRRRVHVKAPCPTFEPRKVLDTGDETAVTLETERWLARHKNKAQITAKRDRRERRDISRARDDMDRVWHKTTARLAALPPPKQETAPQGSAWQRQNRLPEWAVDATVFLGAQVATASVAAKLAGKFRTRKGALPAAGHGPVDATV
jgi:hypothetical protein